MGNKRRHECIGVRVDALTRKELVAKMAEFAVQGTGRVVTYLNAHCVNIAFADREYRGLLEQADIVHADGMGVVWAARFCGTRIPERVNVTDFFPELRRVLCGRASLYLLGGSREAAKGAAEKLAGYGFNVLGYHHGYFDKAQEYWIVEKIRRLKPDILVVGMGVPKQEKWVFRMRERLKVNLLWIAGSGMFDNLSGRRRDAPRWMAHYGLEWLFRLLSDPLRLWRRYLIGIPVFICRILRYKAMHRASQIR